MKCKNLHFVKVLTLALLIETLLPSATARADISYAPKFSFRFANGTLKNVGQDGGSGTSVLVPDAVFDLFLSRHFALGIGYSADFNFTEGIASRSGLNLSGRYYFRGEGTRIKTDTSEINLQTRDLPAYYGGLEYSSRSYYLGSNNSLSTTLNVTGSYSTIDLIVGTDRPLSQTFDLNLELNYGLIAFAGSDNRVVIKATSVLIGITYLFW